MASSEANSPDQGWKLIVAEWVPLFVSTLVVFARFFARVCVEDDRMLKRIKFRRLHVEDHLMALSLLGQFCHAITSTVAVSEGLGHHIWTLDGYTITRTVHLIQTIKGLSIVPSCLGRVSIALYQLRLLPPNSSKWKLAPLMVVIIFDPIMNLVTITQIYAQCGAHVSALWNSAVAAISHCEDPTIETNIGYGQSATNSLCDLILSLFPVVILWDLQMPKRRKIQLYAVLSTSYLALIASIVKTVRIGELSASTDFTWNFVALQIWVCIEVNTIITTGSFPCLFPLLKLVYKRVFPRPYSARSPYPSNPSDPSAKTASSAKSKSSRKGAFGFGNDSLFTKTNGTFMGLGSRIGTKDDGTEEGGEREQELSILKVQDFSVSVREEGDMDEERGVGGKEGSARSVER